MRSGCRAASWGLTLDGASGDVGVGGDLVVAQAVALEPEDLHLALDAGVGVMVAVVGQGAPVVRREGDRSHDGSTRCCSQVAPLSSLSRCTADYNLCQTRPRRVYLALDEVAITDRVMAEV